MTVATQRRPGKTPTIPVDTTRRVGLVTRVSTDRQASNDEGSLKTQLQRLRAHLQYKVACGEDWVEVAVYELRAVSGKDSVRSEEFQRLYADIRAGRINVIAAAALDRVTRSVKDFLTLFEFLQEHGVEFVSLKEQCDTSTPVGRLFATMVMALAQFERETTSVRTQDATRARAERGLWNGGRILGYDPDPDNRSTLRVNETEAAVVNAAFDLYLETGALKDTALGLNARGYRTKCYQSRRGRQHPGQPFGLTSVQQLLRNRAYIAEKELNKRQVDGSQVVPAVWPPIVDRVKFEEVQRLLAANGRRKHNSADVVRHVHVLGGMLHCGHCGTAMQGRSGTGRLGTRYYYYVCTNGDCGLRVKAEEMEGAVLEHIGEMARAEGLLERLVAETNARLLRQKPALVRQQKALQRSLEEVNGQAGKLLAEWTALEGSEGRAFVTERLEELAQRRRDVERGLAETGRRLEEIREGAVTPEVVREALRRMHEVWTCLKPYERQEVMRLVVHRVEVGVQEMVLEIKGGVLPMMASTPPTTAPGAMVRQIPVWLPEQDSNLQPSG